MNTWHYSINGQQAGPVSGEEIRSMQAAGTLHEGTLVWCPLLKEWAPLVQVSHLLPPAPPSAARRPSPAMAALPHDAAHFQPQALPFEFRGRAGEYFGIWIVNVLLTVLTLGIYAAWAKVRTRRYFHGNTLLDGTPFDFTANPVAILKGNLIMGAAFLLLTFSGAVPLVNVVIVLAVALLAPWLIQKALRFRAHNTVHRGVRFNFRGEAGESYGAFLGWPILVPFTLGLLFPYVLWKQRTFTLGRLGWGTTSATLEARPGGFYAIALKTILIALVPIVLISALAALIPSILANARLHPPAAPFVATAAEQRSGGSAEEEAGDEDLTPQERARLAAFEAGFMAAPIAVFAFILLIQIYFTTRLTNYCLNNLPWGGVGCLRSELRVRDMLWLHISNVVVIALTLGLMIPWARCRMARYRASKTCFSATGSLDAVAQSAAAGGSAIGDSAADIFDFDIGF